jgi:hypothetical protein
VVLRQRPLSELEKEQNNEYVWEYNENKISLKESLVDEYHKLTKNKLNLKEIQKQKLRKIFSENENNKSIYICQVQQIIR